MATKADEKPAINLEEFISTGPAPDQLRRQLVFGTPAARVSVFVSRWLCFSLFVCISLILCM